MPRPARPDIRLVLVERAAAMLAAREPVTLRALVEGTGASTMAVYTHFGSMTGLWQAVRHEGFVRLAERLAAVETTDDPVRDLAALGVAYLDNAIAHPDLYRVMFDQAVELDDPTVADDSFGRLVEAAARGVASGRFRADVDPLSLATRYWAAGHGLAMLANSGVLPRSAAEAEARQLRIALFVDAGDERERCVGSVGVG